MANVKISALPSYTGSAADLRWFVMNNSGETETYKYSGYTSPFRTADGFNSTISTYYNPNVVPNKLDMILGGTGNTMAATSSYTDGLGNSIVGGANNVMDLNSPAGGQHYGHSIFGGNNNTLRWRANASVNTIVGGQGNLMDCYYGGNTIIGGSSNTAQGSSNNTIIGAQSSTITGGDRNGIWGGYSQSVGGPSDNNIYGGFDNTITDGSYNSIIGGATNTISNGNYHFIGGGQNNTITGGTNVVMIGTSGKTATQSNTTYVENFNSFGLAQIGSGNTFNDYSGSNLKNALVVGNRNKVDGAPNTPVMFIGNDLDSQQFGSYALHIGNGHYASGSYNLSIGDSGIEMNGNYGLIIGHSGGKQAHKAWGTDNYNLGQSNQTQGITGAYTFGKDHTISNGTWNGIFGGVNHTISSSGNYNAFVGGQDSNITGGTNVVMIGCSGRTADVSNTTYVENLKIFGQAQSQSNNVGSVSTGTRTLDFNTGNIQYFQLTSGSTIVLDATNYKDGATYIVKVKQPSSGTNATMTFTSPLFKFPNGVAPTLSTGNNEEDILSFICIGTTLYGNIQKTFI